MAQPAHRWLRPYALAKKKGVELQTIYRWIREGKIPSTAWRKVTVTVDRIEIDADFPIPRKRAE
jgi:predicted site-specific integrase-resolvase